MIKRHYFISVEKPHNDGKGSYTYDSCTGDFTSWLPNPSQVYNDMCKHMEDKMKDINGRNIRIISFNRI